MTPEEFLWLTGILEGEGTFTLKRAHGAIRVSMTDQDIIDRIHVTSGVGLVHFRGARSIHHRPVWDWDVIRVETVRQLSDAVAPFLLDRRRRRVGELLQRHGMLLPPKVGLAKGSTEAWAWIAGLIEGEGYLAPAPNARRQQPQISVTSVDLDVLERLRILTGVGTIYPIKPRKPSWSPSGVWVVSRGAQVREILTRIAPHLGSRRTERAGYVLGRTYSGRQAEHSASERGRPNVLPDSSGARPDRWCAETESWASD